MAAAWSVGEAVKDKLLRIMGMPRGGTHFTSKLVRSCGLGLPCEHMGTDGTVSWMSCTWVKAVPFGSKEGISGHTFAHTWAVARHPAWCIASMQRVCLGRQSRPNFLPFVQRFIVLPEYDNDRVTACHFFVAWWKLVMAQDPSAIFQVDTEEGRQQLEEAARQLRPGAKPLQGEAQPWRAAAKPTEERVASWDDITSECPAWLVSELSQRTQMLGYDWH